jgi:retron-type reverse transcriptase
MAEAAAELPSLFERLTSWSNLLQAARQARLGKRSQPEVAAFELERERELLRIQDELRNGAYRPGRYRGFWVSEPKRRLISAAPYRDRVVHHALINIIGPLFERNFVVDSYANRLGKGTHRAVDRSQHFAQRYRYVMQFDIVKFFPSLDHAILKQQLRSRIRDERVLWLCDTIIDASNPQEWACDYFPGDDLCTPMQRRRGLPIGNLTSQFWAIVYLHGLDNFVKRGLRCGGYVRYVDDFVIFADSKAELIAQRGAVVAFLERLRLRIHARRAQPRPTSRPTRFLGYRCWPTHRYLTKENIRRFRHRGRVLQRRYAAGELDWPGVRARLASWNAHAATANSHALRWRLLGSLSFQRGPVEAPVSCAAGRGTTIQRTAAVRIATGTGQPNATTTSVFVLRRGVSARTGARMPVLTGAGSVLRESEPDSSARSSFGRGECTLWSRPAHAAIAPAGTSAEPRHTAF